ncbi:MAG: penicillin-binding protein activator, partial [Candidatus Zixiibacteriota bacterium]
MLSRLRLTLLAVTLWSTATVVSAVESLDDRPEVVSEYTRARLLLRDGDYLEAARQFARLADKFPDSKNLDLFIFNRAKAELYFGNRSEALNVLLSFINRFPSSNLIAHAYFFQGNAYYLKGQLDYAVEAYIDGYRLSQDLRLDDLIVVSLVEAVSGARTVALTEADFAGLDPARRCELIEPVARALAARADTAVAHSLRGLCSDKPQVSDSPAAKASNSVLELALLLPFSGEMQSFGEEIYHGAVIAAEQFRRDTGKKLNLVPYDTKGDPIDAGRLVRELVHGATDAIIGPLTSDEAAVASAVLSGETLPLIAPAATQSGLTLLSECVFQLSPNIELQGARAAEYAAVRRGADSAAIITPTTADQMRMARAFAERFEALSGVIVATEYYRPRDRDFGQYVRDLKNILLRGPVDSAAYINDRGDTIDLEAVPAKIDCLYLPGSAEQLRLLLPQLEFYGIDAFYLGSDGWGDDNVYRLGDKVTRGAVFPSPFLELERSQEYVKFASEYDARYGQQPQRLASLGYDAVMLIAQLVRTGAVSRRDLISGL